MKIKFSNTRRGLTLIEILVAVFAVTILSVGGYVAYTEFGGEAVEKVVSENNMKADTDTIAPSADSVSDVTQNTNDDSVTNVAEPLNQEPETTSSSSQGGETSEPPIPALESEPAYEPPQNSGTEIIIAPSPLYQHILDNIYTGPEPGAESSEETEPPPEPEPPTFQTVVVEYTSSGFNPQVITINQGDTVRFSNVGNQNVWVSSSPHPSHYLYPEKSSSDCLGSSFDSCAIFSTGSSWEFTFNSTGSWGYHNHTRAGKTGTIVVN